MDTRVLSDSSGGPPGRGIPAHSRFSRSQKTISRLAMTSGKKAEAKVATLKGQEGNQFFPETTFSKFNYPDQLRTRFSST